MAQWDKGRSSGSDFSETLSAAGRDLIEYLKTRQTESWLFFAAGLIVGLLLG